MYRIIKFRGRANFAEIINELCIKYDTTFTFPLDSIRKTTNGVMYAECIFTGFFLPLLPLKTIKKFMAGQEYTSTQRDIIVQQNSENLRKQAINHYTFH